MSDLYGSTYSQPSYILFPDLFYKDSRLCFPVNSSAKLKSPSWVQFHSFKDFPGISCRCSVFQFLLECPSRVLFTLAYKLTSKTQSHEKICKKLHRKRKESRRPRNHQDQPENLRHPEVRPQIQRRRLHLPGSRKIAEHRQLRP